MALGHQHGLRWLNRPLSSTWPSVVTGVTDPGCCRVILSIEDDTIAPDDGTGHSDQHVPGGSTVLEYPLGDSLQPRPLASLRSLVAAWIIDINAEPGWSRTADSGMVLCSSLRWQATQTGMTLQLCSPWKPRWPQVAAQTRSPHRPRVVTGTIAMNTGPLSCSSVPDEDLVHGPKRGLEITLDLSGQQAIHVSPFPTTLTSPDLPLSAANEPFHLSLLPPLPVVSYRNDARLPGTRALGWVIGSAWLSPSCSAVRHGTELWPFLSPMPGNLGQHLV